MPLLSGQRRTLNITADQRRVEVGNRIALLEPDSTPLTAFLNKLDSVPTGNSKFTALEDVLRPRFDTVAAGGYTNVATSVPVTNPTYYQPEDLILNTATGEIMRVTAAPGTSPITVTRGVGSTALAGTAADEIYILSSAAQEGDVSKIGRTQTPTTVVNYTQIFRDPFSESGTLMSSATVHDPHDWSYTSNKMGIEHAKSIELAFLLGTPSEGADPSVRTTGGAFYFVGTTNQTAVGGALTETTLWTGLQKILRYGRRQKLAFCAATPLRAINAFASSKIQVRQADISDGQNTYGINVTDLLSPFGRVTLVFHPLLEGTKYGGQIIVVDLEATRKRYLNGDNAPGGSRDTHLRQNIQAPDTDGRKDEYLSEVGLQFGQAARHGTFSGITG